MLLSAGVIAGCVLATTTVLIQRIEQRTQRAVLALEGEHMESLAAMAGQRVVGMQRMLRVMADRLPMQAIVDPARARDYIDTKIALGASFDGLFIANADGQTLAHCDAQAGLMLAQRICDAVSRLGVNFGAEWLGVGASIGVVSMDPGTSIKAADWKARADAACYEAKHQGRGRACLARPGPALQLVG